MNLNKLYLPLIRVIFNDLRCVVCKFLFKSLIQFSYLLHAEYFRKQECFTAYAHLDRNINRSHGLPALYWAPRCNREPHNGSTLYNVGLECF